MNPNERLVIISGRPSDIGTAVSMLHQVSQSKIPNFAPWVLPGTRGEMIHSYDVRLAFGRGWNRRSSKRLNRLLLEGCRALKSRAIVAW